MTALSTSLRRQLERAAASAREVAETGARTALQALAAHHRGPWEHMGAEERTLRRRLRAHGRQLGDRRDPHSGNQTIDHLAHECAYEHWHGMLFARFLAENHLLIEPELGVAVTLEDCEELGEDAGVDKWTMAARFAHEMLPQVFRPDHPVFEVRLAREHRLKLEGLVESLPAGVFRAEDSLGWVYQFWQSRKKDEVNRSGSKVGADELPAVTQLFTEPYMVSFLLDNSLGAWWAARHLSEADLNGAGSEAELRRRVAIPGVPLEYLRFVQGEGLPESGDARSSEPARCSSGESTGPQAGAPEAQRFEEVRSPPAPRQAPPRQAVSKAAVSRGPVKESSSTFPAQDVSSSLGARASGVGDAGAPGACSRAGSPRSQSGVVLPGVGALEDRVGLPPGSSLAGSGEVRRSGRQREAAPRRWRLAAGAFGDWPEHPEELRVLDPCCGSGHFLVSAFRMLVPMRMERESLGARDAVDAVLRENLYGLELDPRCVELAAFALALAAWRYPDAGGVRPLPALNLACSGLAVGAAKERWTELAAGHHNLRIALDWLYEEFRDAPVLGSLLNPAGSRAAKLMDWPALSAALAEALAAEESDERHETAVAARGLAKAAELLSGRYHLVVTNVPYLARGKQGEVLRRFCGQRYPSAKNDLATVFLERCLELCAKGGTASLVLPQNWLFLASYKKLRKKRLKTETWHLLARLGPGAFETISGEVVKAILLTLSRSSPAGRSGGVFDDAASAGTMHGLDVSEFRMASEKATWLRRTAIHGTEQARQLKNPDARLVLSEMANYESLANSARPVQGLTTGDNPRFIHRHWEHFMIEGDWVYFQSASEGGERDYGAHSALYWENGQGEVVRILGEGVKGRPIWGRRGVTIGQMSALLSAEYIGHPFDMSCAAIVPLSSDSLLPLYAFCTSEEFRHTVRRIDQKLNVTTATLGKVPFDLERWTRIAGERYPRGLPRPYSDDPTQWIFHGHPCGSVMWDETEKWTAHGPFRTDPAVLQVAIARLLGYRWPAEQDAGLELAGEQREWVRRAGALSGWADEDGIVCIPPVRGEAPAAERLLGLLSAAFGDAWNEGTPTQLLTQAGSGSFDDWLRNHFFEQHCKLFHHRPFVWHVWDGRRRDGFHALVSYHKLAEGDGRGRRLLESLTYSYLGDWITRQQDGVQRGEAGAEDRLAAAKELEKRLAAIIEGEPPFDLFVRWKPLHEQPIGWEPDVNDGVRLNLRPFMAEDLPGGKKGAGLLRARPNVHWRKDRGKEPLTRGRRSKPPWLQDEAWDPGDDRELRPQRDYPWFWNGGAFTGDRVNDVHLSIAAKSAYRRAAERSRR